MNVSAIRELRCPYCLSGFAVSVVLEENAQGIQYGLIRCNCFEFPIVNGILLLNLAKGYGGAEEELQPYAALQAASILFLKQHNLPNLSSWMQRHVPLVYDLCNPSGPTTYLDFARRYVKELASAVVAFLDRESRYEVIGGQLQPGAEELVPVNNWYVARFLTPRAACLRDQINAIDMQGRILSLCCGHGIAEMLLCARDRGVLVTSIDAQILNLLVVKRFINPSGTFICHDVQFPLPFKHGFFGLTISSTCLPEIPCHASFIREAVRVTGPPGHVCLDVLWADPRRRIVPLRYYRFAQNEFVNLRAVLNLARRCSEHRSLFLFYVDDGRRVWVPVDSDIENALKTCHDPFISLIIGEIEPEGPSRITDSEKTFLHLNPLYSRIDSEAGYLSCERLADYPWYGNRSLIPPSNDYLPQQVVINQTMLENGDYISALYRRGILVLLPQKFSTNAMSLQTIRSAATMSFEVPAMSGT